MKLFTSNPFGRWISVLDGVPSSRWEIAGTIVGLIACGAIALQLFHEWNTHLASTLSLLFLIGFTGVYSFWFLYGLRFRHIGVWIPNAIAVLLQVLLLLVVTFK